MAPAGQASRHRNRRNSKIDIIFLHFFPKRIRLELRNLPFSHTYKTLVIVEALLMAETTLPSPLAILKVCARRGVKFICQIHWIKILFAQSPT